jgi:uncharacterized membrane protein YbhN (UPF0104 family)
MRPSPNSETVLNTMTTTLNIRRRLATAGLLLVMAGSLLLAVPGLRGVVDRIGDMSAGWVVLAIGLEVASCVSFVVVFRLFFDDLPKRRAHGVAWTTLGSGSLLPGGGVGGLAIGGWLLHLGGMPANRIVRRSSALFFLTSAANVAALGAAGFLLVVGIATGPSDLLHAGVPALGAVAATAAVLAVPLLWRRREGGATWAANLVEGIRNARQTLVRPNWRVAGTIGYLGFDIAVLWATLAGIGDAPPVAALVLAYIIGYIANMVPIPGGIGVLDAGLAAALVAYGVPATSAGAAVLVYHAIVFWIPGAGGLLAYAALRRRLVPAAEPVRAESVSDGSAPTLVPHGPPACSLALHGAACHEA